MAGKLNLSVSDLEFGKVEAGSEAELSVELTNTGGNQGIPVVYMIPAPASGFRVDFPFGLPYVLAPGKSVVLKVIYSPDTNGPDEGVLHIKIMDRGKLQPQELGLKGN